MYACLHYPGLNAFQFTAFRQCAESFSPHIEQRSPELLLLDLRGMNQIFGRPADIARLICTRAQTAGLEIRVAIAANPMAAVMAARGFTGITVIQPGDEARTLAPLPVDLLNPSQEMRETLHNWGIITCGDLSRLPENGIAERLGWEGLALHRNARGVADAPLVAAGESTEFAESMELDYPLELLEPLSFLLARFLNDICARLTAHGLAAGEIVLTLRLDGGGEYIRTLRLPFPSRDAVSFLKLLQLDLAAHPPPAAILGLAMRANPVQPRLLQTGLFLPQAPEAEKLELTLARLAALVGERNVGSPELRDTHRPGAFRMTRFVARHDPPPDRQPQPPRLAVRLFRPLLPARILAPFGHPQRISAQGISGSVTAWAGPWRSSGDWWTRQPWNRDEWDVALDSGELYRLVHARGDWFVEANYD